MTVLVIAIRASGQPLCSLVQDKAGGLRTAWELLRTGLGSEPHAAQAVFLATEALGPLTEASFTHVTVTTGQPFALPQGSGAAVLRGRFR